MSVLIPTLFESVILGQVEKNLCLKFRLCTSLKKNLGWNGEGSKGGNKCNGEKLHASKYLHYVK